MGGLISSQEFIIKLEGQPSVSYKPIFTTMKKIKLFLLAITRLRTTFSRYVVFRLVLDYILKHKELPQAKITNPQMEG